MNIKTVELERKYSVSVTRRDGVTATRRCLHRLVLPSSINICALLTLGCELQAGIVYTTKHFKGHGNAIRYF